MSVDPLAEKYAGRSPYEYCFSNPLRFIDPTGMGPDDWVEKKDGSIYWDDSATSQESTKKGETYLGKNVVVATHNRDENLKEPINSAKFDLYLENDKTGPSATLYGNTVPSDVSKSGTLAEGLYLGNFGHRNKPKYRNELALRIYNLDGSDGLQTVNGNPNPESNGKTLTGVLFHKGNNVKESLFDSRGNAYSHGCQTGGNYPGSLSDHNAFMNVAGKNFKGSYYLRSNPSTPSITPLLFFPVYKNIFSPSKF